MDLTLHTHTHTPFSPRSRTPPEPPPGCTSPRYIPAPGFPPSPPPGRRCYSASSWWGVLPPPPSRRTLKLEMRCFSYSNSLGTVLLFIQGGFQLTGQLSGYQKHTGSNPTNTRFPVQGPWVRPLTLQVPKIMISQKSLWIKATLLNAENVHYKLLITSVIQKIYKIKLKYVKTINLLFTHYKVQL